MLGVFLFLYRVVIGPVLVTLGGVGFGCRFYPSCSHYAESAVREWGWFRGAGLAFLRVLRCNPWFPGSPHDPVPDRMSRKVVS